MKRIQRITNKQPDAIITADTHIPKSVLAIPQCRTDDFWDAFCGKIRFISDLQSSYRGIPILHGGDVCDKTRLDPGVEAWCIENLPNNIITVPGNHEMPGHNLNYLDNSSLNVLEKAGKIEIIRKLDYYQEYFTRDENNKPKNKVMSIYGFPYGATLEGLGHLNYLRKEAPLVVLLHTSVYKDKPQSDKIQYTRAIDLLKKLPFADLIITGHNHQSFTVEYEGRILVNPGSMMRTSVDQMDFRPRVFLWYSKDNTVKPVYIPIEEGVISDSHITRKKEKEERRGTFDSYIESLSQNEQGKRKEVSYKSNLERYFQENKAKSSVQNYCWEAREKKQ